MACAHATQAKIGTIISTDASWPHEIQPSYSAALAIVPRMIECSATMEMGRAANCRANRLINAVPLVTYPAPNH